MHSPIMRLFFTITITALLILGHPVESKAAESILGLSFKDLRRSLSVPGITTGKDALLRDDLSNRKLSAREQDVDASWNEIEYKHFKLSFSSMLAEPSIDREYHRLTREDSLDAGRLFLSTFQGSYRDSLQSLGKLIEPQVRIGIRF